MTTVSVRYTVNDIDAAIGFYTTRLGFEVQMLPNDLFAMLVRGDLHLALVRPVGPEGPAGGGARMPDGRLRKPGGRDRFSVEVPDRDATVAGLRTAGVRFHNAVVTGVGGKQVVVEDSSGNPAEFFEPILAEARLSPPHRHQASRAHERQ